MTRTIFKTEKAENFKSKIKRIGFNFFPAYRRTGGRIVFISDDYKEVHVRLGLNWTTKNYVGTVFGGSIFGASDPIYMVQLYHILGNEDYIIWDVEGHVKFLKPIKKNVFAKFKSYNKDAGGKISMAAPPKNSIPNKNVNENKENEKILLKERANRYTYEGKFANFNFLQKIERKVFNKKLGLSFSDFKKMKK